MQKMFDMELDAKATAVVALYTTRGLRFATAESCTGGLVAGLVVGVPGSSAVLERGFVTYSNAAKMDCLGVPSDVLSEFGAVSAQTARAMATGALAHAPVDVAVSITGIAGPDGGSAEKPVGLVHFACARRGGGDVVAVEKRFGDIGRMPVRIASVVVAFDLLIAAAG